MTRLGPAAQIVALVVTAAAVLATSAAEWVATDRLDGDVFVLNGTVTFGERFLEISTTPAADGSDLSISALVQVTVEATWDGNGQAPSMQVVLSPEGGNPDASGSESAVLQSKVPVTLSVFHPALSGCIEGAACIQRFIVDFDLLGDPIGGSVTIAWDATAEVLGGSGNRPPSGFSVALVRTTG